MPGTIQVSVLEFMGLQSSSLSSGLSIKVSIGKREYQTWNKGDFSFPLMTLRENLIVALQDDEGNQISHTVVETRLIIEKGVWVDKFPFEGGGFVHMKLQFVLSEEERCRVRSMRELALKKKHSELLENSLKNQEEAATLGSKLVPSLSPNHGVSDSQKGRVQALPSSPKQVFPILDAKVGAEDREGTYSPRKQTTPNDTDRFKETTLIAPMSEGSDPHVTEASHKDFIEKTETRTPPADVPLRDSYLDQPSSSLRNSKSVVAARDNLVSERVKERTEKKSPLEKTPSNVRSMISAFESSLNQESRPHIKAPPAKLQSSKTGLELSMKDSCLNEVNREKTKSVQSITDLQESPAFISKRGVQAGGAISLDTGQLKNTSAEKVQTKATNTNLKDKYIQRKGDTKEKKKSFESFRASVGEAAKFPGQIFDKLVIQRRSNVCAEKRRSDEKLVTKEMGKGIYAKDSKPVNVRGVSSGSVKEVEFAENEHHSFGCSHAWIFPTEAGQLCMTTASKQVMDLTGNFRAEEKSHLEEVTSVMRENVIKLSGHGASNTKVNEAEKASHKGSNTKFQNSVDAEPSRGLVGQAVRVVIMVGFATLVLLTRQRKSRLIITEIHPNVLTLPGNRKDILRAATSSKLEGVV